jgi:hypothetical protein
MPFEVDDVLVIAPCGRDADGAWYHSVIMIGVRETALRRLGLHPDTC